MRDAAQESEADFDRLVAAPLAESIANARSKMNRDIFGGSDAGVSSTISNGARANNESDVLADKHALVNHTLLYGGEYRPLGPISACLNVEEIEQVPSSTHHESQSIHVPKNSLSLISVCACLGVVLAAPSSTSAAFFRI
jgi:hypothetical protein